MGRLPAVAQVVPAARATPTTATTVRHDRPGVSRRRPSPDPAPTEVSLTVWSMSSIDTGASPPTTWCGWRPSAKRSPDGVTAHLQEGAHLSPHSDPRVKWAHAERGFAGHLRGWLDSTSGTIVGRFVYKPPPSMHKLPRHARSRSRSRAEPPRRPPHAGPRRRGCGCERPDLVIAPDTELAALYGVETRVLVQSVKRNPERFPGDFRFRLSPAEAESLRSQIVISKGRGGRRYAPYAFTEQGVAMLSGVLNSPRAIAAKVEIMRARFRPAAPDDRIPRPPGTQAGRAGKAVRRAVQGCLRRHPRAHGSATSHGEALRIPRLGTDVIGVRASRLTSIGSPSPPPQVIGVASP